MTRKRRVKLKKPMKLLAFLLIVIIVILLCLSINNYFKEEDTTEVFNNGRGCINP